MPKKAKVKIVNWPVGTKVRMINCFEATKYKGQLWVTRSEPWKACGSQLVLLEGKSGGFDTSCLEVVSNASV